MCKHSPPVLICRFHVPMSAYSGLYGTTTSLPLQVLLHDPLSLCLHYSVFLRNYPLSFLFHDLCDPSHGWVYDCDWHWFQRMRALETQVSGLKAIANALARALEQFHGNVPESQSSLENCVTQVNLTEFCS